MILDEEALCSQTQSPRGGGGEGECFYLILATGGNLSAVPSIP